MMGHDTNKNIYSDGYGIVDTLTVVVSIQRIELIYH